MDTGQSDVINDTITNAINEQPTITTPTTNEQFNGIIENTTPVKRGRGRPRKNPENSQAFTLQKPKEKLKQPTKSEKKENEEKTERLINLFETVTTVVLRVDTKFTTEEKELIKPATENFIQSFDIETSEQINKYLSPILLLTGLMLWGFRTLPNSPTLNRKIKTNANNTPDTVTDKNTDVTRTTNFNPFNYANGNK